MMKAEGISRELVQNGLPVGRQENAGKKGEEFSALLETRSSTASKFSTFQEAPSSPMCSSGCSDSSVPGVMDSGKAAVVYQKNAVLYQPGISVLATPESGPSPAEVEETPARSAKDGSLAAESTGGITPVLSEIKDFFVRLFSPPGSSAGESRPVASKEAGEGRSDSIVAGFLRRLGTVLSFGLWRLEESQKSDNASKDVVTKASHAGGGSIEGDSHANGSDRQDLPIGGGEATGSEVGKIAGSLSLKVPAKIQKAIQEAARKYDLSADLIAAVIKVESNFNAAAVSKEGAGGLMQLMPSTARALNVRNRFDIQQNIDGGSRYLKSLLERFGGQVELALAAYNVGPEAVKRYDGVPPYRHTRHYVKKVLAYC